MNSFMLLMTFRTTVQICLDFFSVNSVATFNVIGEHWQVTRPSKRHHGRGLASECPERTFFRRKSRTLIRADPAVQTLLRMTLQTTSTYLTSHFRGGRMEPFKAHVAAVEACSNAEVCLWRCWLCATCFMQYGLHESMPAHKLAVYQIWCERAG